MEILTQSVYMPYADLLTQAQQIFQNPSLTFEDLVNLGDPLSCRLCHNDTLPLPAPLDFLISVNEFFNVVLEASFGFNSSLVATPFMNDILNDWVAYVKAPNTTQLGSKYSVFSAHDSTLGFALGLLGYFPGLGTGDPAYASHMEFELWQLGDSFKISLAFNGQYLPLPACNDIVCDFMTWYNSLPLLSPEQWETECYSS